MKIFARGIDFQAPSSYNSDKFGCQFKCTSSDNHTTLATNHDLRGIPLLWQLFETQTLKHNKQQVNLRVFDRES